MAQSDQTNGPNNSSPVSAADGGCEEPSGRRGGLRLVPVTFEEACDFIAEHHRHHKPPQGWKFGVGCARGGRLVAVAVIGRPVSRHRDDGHTLEVTRLCSDGTPNACSMLYGAAWRAARALGYVRLGTYILDSEDGTSLRAAGWRLVGERGGGSWNCPSRPRKDKHPRQRKLLFERRA